MSNIHHNKEQQQFEMDCNGEQAELNYRAVGENSLDFYRTYVPNACRGQGLGAKLVLAALEAARAEGKQVIPSCPFVPRVLAEHPEFNDVIVNG